MKVKRPVLKNYKMLGDGSIIGRVYDHPLHPDGTILHTSRSIEIRTRHNNLFILEEPSNVDPRAV